ncbi:MAG: hypothetical protein M1823_000895 [Watsoniomyces obsoletus]|nr:MAG: hypothetical protein M1823_000895 [Watsoniomyces obsoletus]
MKPVSHPNCLRPQYVRPPRLIASLMAKMKLLTLDRGILGNTVRRKTIVGFIRGRYHVQSRNVSSFDNASAGKLGSKPTSKPHRPNLRAMIGDEELSGLENGCVVLRIYPRPRDIHDTRLVMREIEKFGKVLIWRNARYQSSMHPGNVNNAIQVILQSASSARELVEASPLRISLPSSPSSSISQSSLSPHLPPRTSSEESSPSEESPSPSRIHDITAHPSKFQHRQSIILNPFYGPFSPEYRSPIAADLAKTVPLPGVADVHWECWGGRRRFREVPGRIAKTWIEKGKDTQLGSTGGE